MSECLAFEFRWYRIPEKTNHSPFNCILFAAIDTFGLAPRILFQGDCSLIQDITFAIDFWLCLIWFVESLL